MQFSALVALALAAVASATPVAELSARKEDTSCGYTGVTGESTVNVCLYADYHLPPIYNEDFNIIKCCEGQTCKALEYKLSFPFGDSYSVSYGYGVSFILQMK